MEQMIDAELCLGCFAPAGQSPTCQDQAVDPERQLLWKGPLAGLCLSSSRYTADGMFLSRTVRRGDTLTGGFHRCRGDLLPRGGCSQLMGSP